MKIREPRWLMLALIVVLVPCAFAQEVKDEDIRIGNFQDMTYPLGALSSHVQGVVVVRAKLDNKGNVVEADAISGAKALIADTLANAKTWTFRVNAEKTVVIVYEFRIDNGLCSSSILSQFIFYPPNIATIRSCEAVISTH